MPRDALDGIKTKAGRVVYDRKQHHFTAKDLERIAQKFTPALVEGLPDEKQKEWVETLCSVIDNMSEQLLAIALQKFGLGIFADDIVDLIKNTVSRLLDMFTAYLDNETDEYYV